MWDLLVYTLYTQWHVTVPIRARVLYIIRRRCINIYLEVYATISISIICSYMCLARTSQQVGLACLCPPLAAAGCWLVVLALRAVAALALLAATAVSAGLSHSFGSAARLACAACPAAASAAHDAFAAIAAAALIQARWLVLMCLRMPLIFSEYVDPLCLYTPWLILALLFAGPTNSIF